MEGKNPVHTGAFLTAYDQREFTPDEVVAREGGQNSLDAGDKVDGVTRLEFRRLSFRGAAKTKFLEAFKFDQLFLGRLDAIASEAKNKQFGVHAKEFMDADCVEALLISDFNTCGLGGAWDDYEPGKDHFGRLVCALNLDDKADNNDSSGGSFGLGKTAYAKSSLINTVVYHSVFVPDERAKGVNRRLMAAGVFPRHSYGDHRYGGFAYFGPELRAGADEVRPFENEEALEFWSLVSECAGVDLSRRNDQTGTDILILMPNVEQEKILAAVEDYYFPAILEHRLSVKFFDDGGEERLPKIHERKDLRPFISLFKAAKDKKQEKTDTKEVAELNRHKDHKIGTIAFSAVPEDFTRSERTNHVAVYRDTGMIINYLKVGSDAFEPAVGVFIADKDTHKYLQMAENAAHSEWSGKVRKLEETYPGIGPEIVDRVNNVFRGRFAQFQKGLQPDVVASKTATGLMSRLLSTALSGDKGSNVPPKPFKNPVALHLTRSAREGDHSIWRLRITDNESTPVEPFKLEIYPSISLAGDSRMVAIKHMEFSIKDQSGALVARGTKPSIEHQFERGTVLDYHIEFLNPGQRNFIVRCKCIAEGELVDA